MEDIKVSLKKVNFWRGTRKAFQRIGLENLDYWTRYSVKEKDGRWTEYFGKHILNERYGELYCIDAIVNGPSSEIPAESITEGARFLCNEDGTWKIFECFDSEEGVTYFSVCDFGTTTEGGRFSVRVKSEGMKAFVLAPDVEHPGSFILKTYDDCDAGTW